MFLKNLLNSFLSSTSNIGAGLGNALKLPSIPERAEGLPEYSIVLRGASMRTLEGEPTLEAEMRTRIARHALESLDIGRFSSSDVKVLAEHVYLFHDRIQVSLPADHPLQRRIVDRHSLNLRGTKIIEAD